MFFTDTTEDPAELTNAHYRAIGECTCMVHNSSCITTQQQQETVNIPATTDYTVRDTLIKRKIQLSSYVRKFRMEQLQSHIWLTASSYMGKYLRISSYIRKLFLIYDFATVPLLISLYMRKIWFSFLSVYSNSNIGIVHTSSTGDYTQRNNKII